MNTEEKERARVADRGRNQGRNQGRKMPTREQLRVWRDYIETAELLRSRLGSRMQNESGMSLGDYQVLLALTEAEGHRLRSSEVALNVGWERSRTSHHLGRMERRGLVRREECAEDSRGADVLLTEGGKKLFREGSVQHLRAVQEMFVTALSEAQLANLDDLTASLRERLGVSGG